MARHLIWAVVAVLYATASVQAAPILFTAELSGPAESPPNASPGTGFARVEFDIVAHTLFVEASFDNLLAPTTAAHIHAPTAFPLIGTAGVATQTPSFATFPLGVTQGVFSQTLATDLASTYNPAFVTANGGVANAEAALYNALLQRRAYFNVHTTAVPAGEVRGFLAPVPEPGTISVFALSGLSLLVARRRSRRRRE